jgi:hypothetical protein
LHGNQVHDRWLALVVVLVEVGPARQSRFKRFESFVLLLLGHYVLPGGFAVGGAMSGNLRPQLLIAHDGRVRGFRGGVLGVRARLGVGEPQVEQRGVVAQVAANMLEQVIVQQRGQVVARLRGAARGL